jgi:MYXO-CTERM domain-containing protein
VKRISLLVACVATVCATTPAAAYVRYTLESGVQFKWPQSCVEITAYPADFTSRMPLAEIMSAITGSADAWSSVSDPCTYLYITVAYSEAAMPRAKTRDQQNMVIFRTGTWCKLQDNGTCDPAGLYDPAALAITTVSARMSSGQITDADIEVNARHFQWGDLVASPPTGGMQVHDLRNALTHEMGHLIGLDHTCFPDTSTADHPVDQTGTPIPFCSQVSAEVMATTLFPSADSGDVEKRSLAPDDQQAVCDIYPAANDPSVCEPPQPLDDGGCDCRAAGPAPASARAVLASIALALLWRRRRRQQRRSAD